MAKAPSARTVSLSIPATGSPSAAPWLLPSPPRSHCWGSLSPVSASRAAAGRIRRHAFVVAPLAILQAPALSGAFSCRRLDGTAASVPGENRIPTAADVRRLGDALAIADRLVFCRQYTSRR